MTEYEFLEMSREYGEAVASHSLNFTTVVFAYVIAAHLAGRGLPKTFAWLLSVLYSLTLLGPLLGLYASLNAITDIQVQYGIAYPNGAFLKNTVSRLFLWSICVLPLLIAWCASIAYMHWHVRKRTLHGS